MSLVVDAPRIDPDFAAQNFDVEIPGQVLAGRATKILWRRKWYILALTALLSTPIGLIIYSLPKYYEAEALLTIDTGKTQLSDLQATTNASVDTLTIRTQIDILKSPELTGRVVDKLDLVNSEDIQKLLNPAPTLMDRFTYALQQLFKIPPESKVALTPAQQRQVAIGWLTNRINIENDGRSYSITVRARMSNAALAADTANDFADLYIEFMRDMKIDTLRKANFWLDQQISPLRDRVRSAEEAVEVYREHHGLVLNRTSDTTSVQTQGLTIADQQLSQINSQLITAAGDLADKRSHLRQAQGALKGGELDVVPEVVANPLIQRLREQQAEIAGKVAGLDRSALANYPQMQALRAMRIDLDLKVNGEVSKIIASLSGQVTAAQAHVDSLQKNLAQLQSQVTTQSQAEVTLRQLISEADAARSVFRDFLGRWEQTSSQATLQEPEANLISKAAEPLRPAGPARARFTFLAVVASLLVSGLVALGIDRARGGIRTAEQLEAETGLFPLAFVPRGRGRLFPRLVNRGGAYAGAISHVRSMLRFGDSRFRAQVVLITSATAEEGKTAFAISLAASVGADIGRALLIDAGSPGERSRSVLGQLGLTAKDPQGSQTIGAKGRAAGMAMYEQVLPGVDLIARTLGNVSEHIPLEPTQLIELVTHARGCYDLILLDSPPILAMPDAGIMSSVVDGAVLVVRWRQTRPLAVRSALRTLGAYHVRVLGGVMTQVQVNELSEAECGHRPRDRRFTQAFG